MKEDNLLSLSYGRIIQKDIETSEGLLPENFEGYQIVEPGNIVLRFNHLQNDKRRLRQGLVTPSSSVIRVSN
jgi:type I restriction enzyme S subunit